jgi:hypothetical protein
MGLRRPSHGDHLLDLRVRLRVKMTVRSPRMFSTNCDEELKYSRAEVSHTLMPHLVSSAFCQRAYGRD